MSKRVLIVEDEMILSMMLKHMVSGIGHDCVGQAVSGEEAIKKAETLTPDMILMDIRLQGDLDGVEAITQIQEKMDVSVIYITGNTDERYTDRLQQTKYLDFLTKPVSLHQLSNSMSRAS